MNNENNSQTNSHTNPDELDNPGIQWSKDIDVLLSIWCDQAKCYEWMHTETSSEYDKKAKKFMIAINILTAVSGVSNIMAGGYQIGGFQVSWLFGTISVLTSTLNIIQNKLAYQTLAESHKKTSLQWSRIISKIEEVVILPPNTRTQCKPFMKYIRNDINHAKLDGDSLIPSHIRELCYEKFKNVPNFDIPDVCGQVEHTNIYTYPKIDDIAVPLISPRLRIDKNKKTSKSPISSKEFIINTSSDESNNYVPVSSIANIKVPNNTEEKLPQSPVLNKLDYKN